VIYLDTSVVALAYLLTEDRALSASIWQEQLVSSRLLEYEIWNWTYALTRRAGSRIDRPRCARRAGASGLSAGAGAVSQPSTHA